MGAHPAPRHAGPDLQGEETENDGPLRRQAAGPQPAAPADPPRMAHQRAGGSAGTPCLVTHGTGRTRPRRRADTVHRKISIRPLTSLQTMRTRPVDLRPAQSDGEPSACTNNPGKSGSVWGSRTTSAPETGSSSPLAAPVGEGSGHWAVAADRAVRDELH